MREAVIRASRRPTLATSLALSRVERVSVRAKQYVTSEDNEAPYGAALRFQRALVEPTRHEVTMHYRATTVAIYCRLQTGRSNGGTNAFMRCAFDGRNIATMPRAKRIGTRQGLEIRNSKRPFTTSPPTPCSGAKLRAKAPDYPNPIQLSDQRSKPIHIKIVATNASELLLTFCSTTKPHAQGSRALSWRFRRERLQRLGLILKNGDTCLYSIAFRLVRTPGDKGSSEERVTFRLAGHRNGSPFIEPRLARLGIALFEVVFCGDRLCS